MAAVLGCMIAGPERAMMDIHANVTMLSKARIGR